MASIAVGTAAGQLALGLAVPVIAYLYSAADIGLFAILLGYGEIAAIVITARIEEILPRLASGRRWVALRIVIRGIVVLGPVAAVAVAVLAGLDWLNPSNLAGLTLLVGALAAWSVSKYVLLTTKNYHLIGLQRGVNGAITAVAQVVGGLIAPSFFTLLLTYAIGNVAATVMSLPALRTISRAYAGEPSATVVREERLLRFGLNVGPGALLSNLSLTLPLVGASILFGNAAAGTFWLARRVLITQTRLIATAISDTTYAMTVDSSPSQIASVVRSWVHKLRTPCVCMAVFGVVAAPFMAWITGDDYRDIATVVLLLSVPAVLQFMTTSLSKVLLAMHMEHIRTVWHVGRLAGLFLLFWFSRAAHLSFVVTVAMFALYTVAAYSVLLAVITRGAREFARV